MRNKNCIIIALVFLLIFNEFGNTQSQSEFALIRRPVFDNPPVWRLTKSETQSYWNIDLFSHLVSTAQSYIMDTSYELYTAVSFNIDQEWDRFVYFEALDDWIKAYGSHGTANCQFWWPSSIAVIAASNSSGYSPYYTIFIADQYNNRIVRLQYEWQNQLMYCYPPITGGGLKWPVDLDINNGGTFLNTSDDYLWLINGNNQIKRLSYDGTIYSTFGTEGCTGQAGEFCNPTAIVSGRSDQLSSPYDPYANTYSFYIADAGNNRLVWLVKASVGEMISWMKEVSTSSSIIDLEVDNYGQVWALDQDAGTITKYTYDLFPLCTFGSSGVGENQFCYPKSISTYGGYLGNGNIYITESWTDSSGGQYFGIGTDILDFSISSISQQMHFIEYTLIDLSDIAVKIFNSQGGLVKTIFDGGQSSGACSFIWNGTDNSGQAVSSGNYRVEITDSCIYWDITSNEPANVVVKEEWFNHVQSCCVLRGDIAIPKDGLVLNNDIVFLVNFLFKGGTPPECLEEADCAIPLDGNIIVNDIVWLVNYVFKGGQAPPDC